MLVLDTSAIVALADSKDMGYSFAVEAVKEHGPHLLIPCWLTAEATYMLNARIGPDAVESFLRSCSKGEMLFEHCMKDIDRALELIGKYSDLPLDFVDATVVACGERNKAPVLSLDRRGFSVVEREGTFQLI